MCYYHNAWLGGLIAINVSDMLKKTYFINIKHLNFKWYKKQTFTCIKQNIQTLYLFEDIFICCHVKNILDEECVVFGWLAWMAEW